MVLFPPLSWLAKEEGTSGRREQEGCDQSSGSSTVPRSPTCMLWLYTLSSLSALSLARSLLSVFMVSLCCFGHSLVQCVRFALLFFASFLLCLWHIAVIPEPFQPRLHKSWDRVREWGADRQTERIQRELQEGGWMWFKFWCQLNCIARGCWTNSFEG